MCTVCLDFGVDLDVPQSHHEHKEEKADREKDDESDEAGVKLIVVVIIVVGLQAQGQVKVIPSQNWSAAS